MTRAISRLLKALTPEVSVVVVVIVFVNVLETTYQLAVDNTSEANVPWSWRDSCIEE